MVVIYRLNGLEFKNQEKRYIYFDAYSNRGMARLIGTRYIDVDYKKKQKELSHLYYSAVTTETSAGIIVEGCLNTQNDDLDELPLMNANRVLHTMVDRIDDLECFRRWLRWYKEFGFDGLSIALNDYKMDKNHKRDIMEVLVFEIDQVFEKAVISIWPYEHRYKPCFKDIEYLGESDIIRKFTLYAPGNFHHIQHVALRHCANIFETDIFGYFDIDEFVELDQTLPEKFWEIFENLDVAYFRNEWNYLVSKNPIVTVRIGESMPIGSRSKYIVRRNQRHTYGIHQVDGLGDKDRVKVVGRIRHIYNMSEYSGRRSKTLKDALRDSNCGLDKQLVLGSMREL